MADGFTLLEQESFHRSKSGFLSIFFASCKQFWEEADHHYNQEEKKYQHRVLQKPGDEEEHSVKI